METLKKAAIIAFFLTLLVFLSGISISYLIQRRSGEEVNDLINEIKMKIDDADLSFVLVSANKNITCTFLSEKVNDIKNDLRKITSKVVSMEKDFKINEEYKHLKRELMILRLKLWLLVSKMNEECNEKIVPILFFYNTNKEVSCDYCYEEGEILSYVSEKNSSIIVIALDGDEDLILINTLKKVYNITTYPTIIINDKKLEGFVSKEKILEVLNLTNETYKK